MQPIKSLTWNVTSMHFMIETCWSICSLDVLKMLGFHTQWYLLSHSATCILKSECFTPPDIIKVCSFNYRTNVLQYLLEINTRSRDTCFSNKTEITFFLSYSPKQFVIGLSQSQNPSRVTYWNSLSSCL